METDRDDMLCSPVFKSACLWQEAAVQPEESMRREQRRRDQWLALGTEIYQATDDGDAQFQHPISSGFLVLTLL